MVRVKTRIERIPRGACWIFLRDLVLRNRAFFVTVLLLGLAMAGILFFAANIYDGYILVPFLTFGLFLLSWPMLSLFFDNERSRNPVYAMLPVPWRRRARILWFQQVILLPALLWGPSILALLGLAAAGLFRTDPGAPILRLSESVRPIGGLVSAAWVFPVLYGLASSTLMAVQLLVPRLKGVAVTVTFPALVLLVIQLAAEPEYRYAAAVLPLLIALSFVIGTRRRLDSPAEPASPLWPRLLARFRRPSPAHESLEAMGLWWGLRRVLILAIYVVALNRYLDWFPYYRIPALVVSLAVSIPACQPFIDAAVFARRRWRLARALPLPRGRLALTAYAYGLLGSAVVAVAAILAIWLSGQARFGFAFFAGSALLGLMSGALLAAPVFLAVKNRWLLQAVVYFVMLIATAIFLGRWAPVEIEPLPLLAVLGSGAFCAIAGGFYWFRRVCIRDDGRRTGGVEERTWIEF